MDDVELAVLPASHSQQESEQVRLLLGLEGLEVLVGSHLSAERQSAFHPHTAVASFVCRGDSP